MEIWSASPSKQILFSYPIDVRFGYVISFGQRNMGTGDNASFEPRF